MCRSFLIVFITFLTSYNLGHLFLISWFWKCFKVFFSSLSEKKYIWGQSIHVGKKCQIEIKDERLSEKKASILLKVLNTANLMQLAVTLSNLDLSLFSCLICVCKACILQIYRYWKLVSEGTTCVWITYQTEAFNNAESFFNNRKKNYCLETLSWRIAVLRLGWLNWQPKWLYAQIIQWSSFLFAIAKLS